MNNLKIEKLYIYVEYLGRKNNPNLTKNKIYKVLCIKTAILNHKILTPKDMGFSGKNQKNATNY